MLFSAELPWCYFHVEIKFSELDETFWELFLGFIMNYGAKIYRREIARGHKRTGQPQVAP